MSEGERDPRRAHKIAEQCVSKRTKVTWLDGSFFIMLLMHACQPSWLFAACINICRGTFNFVSSFFLIGNLMNPFSAVIQQSRSFVGAGQEKARLNAEFRGTVVSVVVEKYSILSAGKAKVVIQFIRCVIVHGCNRDVDRCQISPNTPLSVFSTRKKFMGWCFFCSPLVVMLMLFSR